MSAFSRCCAVPTACLHCVLPPQAMTIYSKSDHIGIANYVGTRSAVQVRTHSQKHFLALSKGKTMHLLKSHEPGYVPRGPREPKRVSKAPEAKAVSDVKPSTEVGVCEVCKTDDKPKQILVCDHCDRSYHTYCLNPTQMAIPPGLLPSVPLALHSSRNPDPAIVCLRVPLVLR